VIEQVLVLLLVSSSSLVAGVCDTETEKENFETCRTNITNGTGTLCEKVSNIIENCSVLLTCRSEEQVKQINAELLNQNTVNGSETLEGCAVVEEYRQEGLLGAINCTEDQNTKFTSDFRECTYSISEGLVAMKDNITLLNINQVVCGTLKNASTSCKGMLDRCREVENKEEIFTNQMENIQNYIQTKLEMNDTITFPTLQFCKVTTDIINTGNDIVNFAKSTLGIKQVLSQEENIGEQQQQIGVESSGINPLQLSWFVVLPLVLVLFI